MLCDSFDTLEAVAAAMPRERWVLIGGLMVHCHAREAGVAHARPTHDADLVVEIRVSSYGEAARAVQSIGFDLQEPLDVRAPVHRFARAYGAVIDLMVAGRVSRPPVYRGRRVVEVPVSASAMKRTTGYTIPTGTRIRLPDLPAALALKSWAKFLPGASRERHLQDAVTLLVCTDRQEVALSRSMRSVVRRLLAKIATDEVA
ncbi:hypothetical protein WDY66_08925 [Dermacoccus nishinomiyaensis]|nr:MULTISPECIES: hypothetical protein [Dermacoccus]MBO1757672.1 hypothetical protein [Dermacoccus sp. NHGro5]